MKDLASKGRTRSGRGAVVGDGRQRSSALRTECTSQLRFAFSRDVDARGIRGLTTSVIGDYPAAKLDDLLGPWAETTPSGRLPSFAQSSSCAEILARSATAEAMVNVSGCVPLGLL